MERLPSHLAGAWIAGEGTPTPLLNPATEEPLAEVAAPPGSLAPALAFARERGGQALRAMTFAERAGLLRALARAVHAHRDELIAVAMANGGNTRGDAKFDIDGASAVLSHYADLGEKLGGARFLLDGEATQLSRSARWHGQHVLVPRTGVAVLVNAFNFPAWGVAEKAACALLAGMPVLARPATPTALVAHRFCALLIPEVPPGVLSLLVGPAGDLVERLEAQDVLAFTGSSATAAELRGRAGAARVNVEADSLNVALVGPDVGSGSPTYDQLLADVVKEMTQKAGQKCTAIRRVLAPAPIVSRLGFDIAERLSSVRVGNPTHEDVTMGPLASARQRDDVRAGILELAEHGHAVFGGDGSSNGLGSPVGKGFFVSPVLFEAREPDAAAIHEREVFGPVATIVPADDVARAGELARRGGGGLVASIYSDDRAFVGAAVAELAPWHGRLHLASAKIAGQTMPPGTALPQLLHGGPGRAGGGEELGGLGGLRLYQQRTAIAGDKAILDAITKP